MLTRHHPSRVALAAALLLSVLGAGNFGATCAEARSARLARAASASRRTRSQQRLRTRGARRTHGSEVSKTTLGGGAEPPPGQSQTDSEMCVGCQFVWDRTNKKLDQSSGYEETKNAFERTCADMPNVFFDACDAMFDKEDQMVQDYLNGAKFEDMCRNALMCLTPAL